MNTKAAFFDRDGTIIKDVPYLSCVEQIEFIKPAIELCKLLYDNGYKIFIVTNQSGIARGFFDETALSKVHHFIAEEFLSHHMKIEKFYFCPHHKAEAKLDLYKVDCYCRKPRPGMILSASNEYSIDLSKSVMFGDRESDILAGQKAGVRSFYIQDILENRLCSLEIIEKVRKEIL